MQGSQSAQLVHPIGNGIFQQLFVIPVVNLLVAFIALFSAIGLPGAFGLAVIALVVTIRLLLHPLFKQMTESQKKMQAVNPHLVKLKEKHKDDPKKLQEETMRLYKEHGFNPASGCLPMLIQIPVFFGLYSALNAALADGSSAKAIAEINKVLYTKAIEIQKIDPHFLGYNLALTPQHAGAWHYYLVPLVTGLLQYAQTKYASPVMAAPTQDPVPSKKSGKKLAKGEQPKEPVQDTQGEFQKAMNMQMKYIFPVMIAYFAYILPVGLALYWNIFALFSILQYRRVNKS